MKKGVQLAQAQQQEAVLSYQQTIQQAFREVSDGLIAYAKDQEFRKQQDLLTQSAADASRLSDLRYRGGAASYLEVLDSNTRYYSAELSLAQGQLKELLDYVQLYQALGGGWQQYAPSRGLLFSLHTISSTTIITTEFGRGAHAARISSHS